MVWKITVKDIAIIKAMLKAFKAYMEYLMLLRWPPRRRRKNKIDDLTRARMGL
jgi:hypothetical protein